MQNYLFRVEAVNLVPTVYDTSDISTIRGGGFYLLDRVSSLADSQVYRTQEEKKITEGASSAVFRFQLESDDAAEQRRKELLEDLFRRKNGEKPIREMMFMVEYVKESDDSKDFASDMAKLLGKIRLAQMQSPSVRIFEDTLEPGLDKKDTRLGFDKLNRVLPAHTDDGGKDEISNFTYERREQGKDLRKRIYRKLLEKRYPAIKDYAFTDDLENLCKDHSQGNLDGKMAFIYIDGNKFGALQRSFSETQLMEYDGKLQGFKEKFLEEVIKLAEEHPAFKKNDRTIRLETLLWGGDEIKMIVPAWMGWEVASCFFRVADDRKMTMPAGTAHENGPAHVAGEVSDDPETKMPAETPPCGKDGVCELTYAMGLVFAHHKNPIRNVDEIAADLADCVKEELKEQAKNRPEGAPKPVYDRARGNRMHYMVLESLETLPTGYGEFAKKYYKADSAAAVLSHGDMGNLRKLARDLSRIGFPKSRIHSMALAKAKGDEKEYEEYLEKGFQSCETGEGDKKKIIGKIEDLLRLETAGSKDGAPMQRPLFTQLAELWDYLIQD